MNTTSTRTSEHGRSLAAKVVRVVVIVCLGSCAMVFNPDAAPAAQATPSDRNRYDQQQQIAAIERIAHDAVKQYHLQVDHRAGKV